MKYFYHHDAEGSLSVDEFLDVIEAEDRDQVCIIDDAAQGAVQFTIKRGKKDFTNCCFQLEGDFWFEFDQKGAVKSLSNRPSWAKSSEDLEQLRLVSLYGLEQLSFMDGIQKLSTQPVDTVQAILKGLLPQLQFSNSKQVESEKVDKKPKVKTLDKEHFDQFLKLFTDAVKNNTLPSMGYFESKGIKDADLKRGFRTYYRAIIGDNMKPNNFTPGSDYFEDVQKRIQLIHNEGVGRAYNAITSQLDRYKDLPISTMDYHFKG